MRDILISETEAENRQKAEQPAGISERNAALLKEQGKRKAAVSVYGKELGKMKKVWRAVGIFTVSVVILVLCMGITASAKAKVDRDAQSRYYLEQEKKMAGEVQRYLEEQGYRNSGVMITRTVRKDGHIVYKLTVHHRRISSLDEAGKELLLAELEQFAISDENCSCVQEIMQ